MIELVIALKQLNQKQALIVSAIVAMSIFGLTHLSAYAGNVYQCLFIIGHGHLPSMYAFLKSQTLWVPNHLSPLLKRNSCFFRNNKERGRACYFSSSPSFFVILPS